MTRISGIQSTTERGFTVVELVVILVLVALLAFAVIPRYQDKGAINVSALAEQLASDVRYTQSLAMTSGQHNRINLVTASYQITTSTGVPVAHPATGSSAAISLSNVSLTLSGLANGYIAFDGKGIPYTDVVAGTPLGASATITLNSAGSTRQIVVSPQTGRVLVQ